MQRGEEVLGTIWGHHTQLNAEIGKVSPELSLAGFLTPGAIAV